MNHDFAGYSVSILLHGAIVAAVVGLARQEPPPEPVTSAVPLSLSMFAPAPPEPVKTPPPPEPEPVVVPEPVPEPIPEVKPKPKPKQTVKPRPVVKPKPKPKPRPVTPPPPIPEPIIEQPVIDPAPLAPVVKPPPPTPKPAAPAQPAVNAAKLEDSYKAKLRSAIEAKKHYPARARRMRQQGTVTLSLTMRRDGTVDNVSVLESSGSKILDKAAMDSVRSIDGQIPFPENIQRQQWTLTVPLKFSLR